MFPTREEAKALLAEAADGTFPKSLTKRTPNQHNEKGTPEGVPFSLLWLFIFFFLLFT